MPLVRIDITGPKPPEYRRALLTGAREAITSAFGVPTERVAIRIVETPAADVDVHACRTERFTQVEVLMYEGRPPELKGALVSTLRERYASDPGIEPCEVIVHFRDASRDDLNVLPGEATERRSIH